MSNLDFTGTAIKRIQETLTELQAAVDEFEAGTVDATARAAADTAQQAADAAQAAADAAQGTADGAAADVVTAQAAADAAQADVNALSASLPGARVGTVQLNGANPTPVNFREDGPATILGTVDGPFALDHGLTMVVNPDGAGDDTVTFQATAGTSVSAAPAPETIAAEVDTKFMISVDGDAPEEVTITPASCDTGANTAAELQTQIQALGGNKAAVTVSFGGGQYTITSGTKGTGSGVVITDSPNSNIAEELKLGVANGGVETAGTGDAVNIAAATAAEVAAAITAGATGWTAQALENKVLIISDTTGRDSSLAVNAASTADLILGISGNGYGRQGLNYLTDMADTSYRVFAMLKGVASASLSGLGLGITGLTMAGFNVECETAASEAFVELLIIGAVQEQ